MVRHIADYSQQFMCLYNEGLSDPKIAEALGFHRRTVCDFRNKLGLPPHFKFGQNPFVFSEEQKREITRLHGEDSPIKHIAEKLSIDYQRLQKFCRDEGLDTSMARRVDYRKRRDQKLFLAYLREHGPTSQRVLSKELGISMVRFNRWASELFDWVERFKFAVGTGSGGRGGVKHGGYKIYDGVSFSSMGYIFALRDDLRIIDFVARYIPFKLETPHNVATLVQHLKKQLGYDRARQVVEKLGYVYKEKIIKTPVGHVLKFTDEQLIELYNKDLNDVQIAKILRVTPPAIRYRRNRLRLPVIDKRKCFWMLDKLDQIEELKSK